jgi:hypothetical protein
MRKEEVARSEKGRAEGPYFLLAPRYLLNEEPGECTSR